MAISSIIMGISCFNRMGIELSVNMVSANNASTNYRVANNSLLLLVKTSMFGIPPGLVDGGTMTDTGAAPAVVRRVVVVTFFVASLGFCVLGGVWLCGGVSWGTVEGATRVKQLGLGSWGLYTNNYWDTTLYNNFFVYFIGDASVGLSFQLDTQESSGGTTTIARRVDRGV